MQLQIIANTAKVKTKQQLKKGRREWDDLVGVFWPATILVVGLTLSCQSHNLVDDNVNNAAANDGEECNVDTLSELVDIGERSFILK
jgi:hypothetical protein